MMSETKGLSVKSQKYNLSNDRKSHQIDDEKIEWSYDRRMTKEMVTDERMKQ